MRAAAAGRRRSTGCASSAGAAGRRSAGSGTGGPSTASRWSTGRCGTSARTGRRGSPRPRAPRSRCPARPTCAQLAPHLRAPLAAQRAEVVVERAVVAVAPVVLYALAVQEAGVAQRRDLVGGAEVDVHGGDLVATCRRRAAPARRPSSSGGRGTLRVRQHALPGGRRERHGDQQLRVVGHAGALGGLGPGVVEDELALAVALEIHRRRRDQPAALAHREVMRRPAGLSPSRSPTARARRASPTRGTASRPARRSASHSARSTSAIRATRAISRGTPRIVHARGGVGDWGRLFPPAPMPCPATR